MSARRLRIAMERSVYLAVDLQTGQTFLISPSGESGPAIDWEPAQVARLPSGVRVDVSFGANPWRGKLLPNLSKLDDGA